MFTSEPSASARNGKFYGLLATLLLTVVKIVSNEMLIGYLPMPPWQPGSHYVHVLERLLKAPRKARSDTDGSIRGHLISW